MHLRRRLHFQPFQRRSLSHVLARLEVRGSEGHEYTTGVWWPFDSTSVRYIAGHRATSEIAYAKREHVTTPPQVLPSRLVVG
jgi:hypothetical protein